MQKLTVTPTNLRRRARHLLEEGRLPGRKVLETEFLEPLSKVGRVALFGGALRDLAYARATEFCSDLDFVIEINDRQAYEQFLRRFELRPNKFGGYGISISKLKIDFWDAENSWAHTQGYRHVSCLEDMLETTFFNIDALLYLIEDRQLVERPNTLDAIKCRHLDINLEPNPNPLGATVRALRRMYQFDMSVSDHLAQYLAANIDHYGWNEILDTDRSAYAHHPILSTIFKQSMRTGADFLHILSENNNRIRFERQLPFIS